MIIATASWERFATEADVVHKVQDFNEAVETLTAQEAAAEAAIAESLKTITTADIDALRETLDVQRRELFLVRRRLLTLATDTRPELIKTTSDDLKIKLASLKEAADKVFKTTAVAMQKVGAGVQSQQAWPGHPVAAERAFDYTVRNTTHVRAATVAADDCQQQLRWLDSQRVAGVKMAEQHRAKFEAIARRILGHDDR